MHWLTVLYLDVEGSSDSCSREFARLGGFFWGGRRKMGKNGFKTKIHLDLPIKILVLSKLLVLL